MHGQNRGTWSAMSTCKINKSVGSGGCQITGRCAKYRIEESQSDGSIAARWGQENGAASEKSRMRMVTKSVRLLCLFRENVGLLERVRFARGLRQTTQDWRGGRKLASCVPVRRGGSAYWISDRLNTNHAIISRRRRRGGRGATLTHQRRHTRTGLHGCHNSVELAAERVLVGWDMLARARARSAQPPARRGCLREHLRHRAPKDLQ